MTASADKFLETFFSKLLPTDFKSDRVLDAFYTAYNHQLTLEPIGLFQFFTSYITRNKQIDDANYKSEVKKIYASIMHEMLNPVDIVDDDNPRLRLTEVKEDSVSPMRHINTSSKIKYKLSKLHALSVICEYIKMSFIVTNDTPDIETRQEDVDFRNNTTIGIAEEIIAEKGSLPVAIKDVDFERRNAIIEIWHSCENKCVKFIEKDALAEILKKVYIFDCSELTTQSKQLSTYADDTDDNLPSELLNSLCTNQQYKTIVSVLRSNVLTESMNRSRQKIKNLMVVSENQFNTGGNTEQGFESNITPIYLSSSYCLSLNRASYVYPLNNNIVIYSPSVLVFKDHTKKNYPILGPTAGCSISVLTSAPMFRPKLNVSIDKYEFDQKLFLPTSKYINSQLVEQQLINIFNMALFFNYSIVIIDDRGPLYSYSPIHHTAQIMASVINRYKSRFAEIIVCVPDDKLYSIYTQYIN